MAFWQDRRVLVTGASGYLARLLIKELVARGAVVVGTDLRAPTGALAAAHFVEGDLTEVSFVTDVLARHDIVTCFHLAGRSGVADCQQNPLQAFEANCRGTWALLEGCRLHGKLREVVVASSNHVYGHQRTMPTPEDAPLNGIGVYAASKACADLIARCYARNHGVPVAVARITNTFGGLDPHSDHLITGTIASVLRGERPVIRGNGRSTKAFLYVADTIAAFILLAEMIQGRKLMGHAINFVPPSPASVREVVETILRVAGKPDLEPVVIGAGSAAEEIEHLSGAKAKELLGWEPRWTLAEGLRQAVEDYRRLQGVAG